VVEDARVTGAVARSPIRPELPEGVLSGWVVSRRRTGAALTLTDCTPLAKVIVRAGWDGAVSRLLGASFGRAMRQALDTPAPTGSAVRDVLVVGSGPGEWLVLGPPGEQGRLARTLEAAVAGARELVTVVDVTHGRAVVRLTGIRGRDVLAKECAADLGDEGCPNGAALRGSVGGLITDLVRDDTAGRASYLLHCERSSGQYLFDTLLDAGREFGVEVDGFVLPGL
jgi:heterotetrameric sarcosine oxidase gamma subunit